MFQAFDGLTQFSQVFNFISWFYPTREIHENLTSAYNMLYGIHHILCVNYL